MVDCHAGLRSPRGFCSSATVLTFKTPKGTLIVEVDDPNVKVSLDGEELTITGAGPHEVRLKPGNYDFVATKDGKLVKQEIVTIEKDGKQVVKVTVEPPPKFPDPVPVPGTAAKKGGPYVDLFERTSGEHPPHAAMADAARTNATGVPGQEGQDRPVRLAGDGPLCRHTHRYPELQSLVAQAV